MKYFYRKDTMNKQLIFDQLVGDAWKKTKDKIWFWIGLLIIVTTIPNIPTFFNNFVNQNNSTTAGDIFVSITTILSMILGVYLSIGEIRIFLNHDEEKKLAYSDLYKDYKLFWKYLGTIILYVLIVFAGIILLIVPGIIWATRFQFAPFFVVDKKVGPLTALKMSAAITNGNMWSLIGLSFVLGLIYVIGFFALFVGIFWAYPMIMIIKVRIYKILSEGSKINF